MEVILSWKLVVGHLFVAFCGWIIMLVVGGGIGDWLAKLIARRQQKHPQGEKFRVLLPWRSIVIFIALFFMRNQFIAHFNINLGLGIKSDVTLLAIALTALFIPWSTRAFLRSWGIAAKKNEIIPRDDCRCW
jgi:polyferredoxin